ncbi:MAG TPA: hypothetical protein VFJ18_03180, partial [Pararhizobium sp.]|nr:hypothetical protein [Pararhizobium sp.]
MSGDMECQFIPHAAADAFRADGWDVADIPHHHGAHAMLASREADDYRAFLEQKICLAEAA